MNVRPRRLGWVLAAAMLVAALVRLPLLTRQGLWVDEVFSLAMATGHSLEHPAAQAEPAAGDFVEGGVAAAADWSAYLRHEEPPASLARVLRAARLSDTSPPLYYVLLWAWTRALGTSDAALRALSLVLALACCPLLARLARRTGGRAAVAPTLFLFALAPLAVYYATEGRMYALLWLELVLLAELSLGLRARGASGRLLAWCLVSAAGFLTHYFFAFVWVALTALLFLRRRRLGRGRLAAGVLAVLLAILPWYVHLGASLGAWRVTAGWLEREPAGFARGAAALELLTGFFGGGAEPLWGENHAARTATLVLFGLAFAGLAGRWRARTLGGRRLVLWVWLAAGCASPLVFDALLGTYTLAVPRYALAGLPAALLLGGAALAVLPGRARTLLTLALVLAFVPHLRMLHARPARSWCPLRESARALERRSGPQDLILVHSIPSGVLGIARYHAGPAPFAAWVEQLEQRRVPDSLEVLLHGRRRVFLVRIHEVGASAPVEDWLRAHAVLESELEVGPARILGFVLPESGLF